MDLCLIFRKKLSIYFSIEKVFSLLIPEMERIASVEEISVPEYSQSISRILKNLRALRSYRADIFHVTGDIHYAVLALPKSRTILTIHDTVFMESARGLKRRIIKWLYLSLPVASCRYITAISEATKKDIVRYTGCDPDKILVIADPADPAFTYRHKNFNSKNPLILQIGTWPNKNLERVAAALLNIPCRLLIIGKPTEAQVEILQLNNIDYSFKTALSNNELIAEYQAADIVVFASSFEGFGLPILEAQACGTPLLTSDLAPMNEICGEGACLVDPFDIESIRLGILQLIENDVYRNQLISDGLENVKKYAPERIASQYIALYEKMLSKI
jgi:glycosyltransferase involved in cell wall biosynthesis